MSGGFIHLRVHSAYSLSEGAIRTKQLVEFCQDQKMPAVAVTDSGNLFGALEFATEAAKGGVQPIIGCQIALQREDGDPRAGAMRPDPDQLVLLVQNEQGYRNLLKLVSAAFLETELSETPQVSLERLAAHAEGLIALTGGPAGPVGRPLAEGRPAEARAVLERLKEVFPGRLYVELMRHGSEAEAAYESGSVDLAYELDVPLVATNEAFFPTEDLYEAHDALLCIAGGTYVAESNRRRLTPNHRLKTAAEMRALFADLPEAVDNTLVIARRCAYFPETVKPILPAFPTAEGRSEAEELRAQAEAGLAERLENEVFTAEMDEAAREKERDRYSGRLRYELEIIEQMGFPGYFLIVSDFIVWAKQQGIPVGPGRGSGAGSVVAWALTITDLDPLRWGLLFERFLNPERVSMPDFDIDFCQDRRDEVIGYVQRKYGFGRVAQIITFGKLQARAVIRDVGRVLQMPYGQVDRICKMIPNNPADPKTIAQSLEEVPELRAEQESDENVARLIEIGQKLEGLYRHASTHAAGVVIGDRELNELVPLYRDPRSEMPVTQFNMKWVEQAGLMKFDFLGLKTLTVLATANRLIAERTDPVDLEALPLDDPATYQMLSRGDTVGVFQLESSGMRDALKRLKPDRFEDIIAVVALYRPGPMENIPAYIARKHGQEKADYLYPTLEPILKETHGIMIYQEQVMQIAQELAGFSLGAADLLRRAMGKKIQAEMDAQRESFVEGAVARGVDKKKASEIFDLVDKFAGYGFNKSHAAAYAKVAYQTAYLKANYPVEFLAASMTYDMGNTDKLNIFRQELARLDIPLLPPDINRSAPEFSVEAAEDGSAYGIRYALAAIRNVGFTAMQGVVAQREEKGPFKSLADFSRRLDGRLVNKRQIENLACAGAFDSLVDNRHQVYAAAETVVRHAAAAAEERSSGQVSLFGEAEDSQSNGLALPAAEDWGPTEKLQYEFDAVGFYLSAHPLDSHRKTLERLGVLPFGELARAAQLTPGRKTVAGIVVSKQIRTSRKGNRFAFVTLSDSSGVYEVVLFSEVLAASREHLESNQPLLLEVTVDMQGDEMKLMAQKISPLDAAAENTSPGLKVYLRDPEPLDHLKSILAQQGRGRGRVLVVVETEAGEEVSIQLPEAYKLSGAVRQAIKSIGGLEVQDL